MKKLAKTNDEEEEKEEEESSESCARTRVWQTTTKKKKKKRIVRRNDEVGGETAGRSTERDGAIIARLDHSYHHVLSTPRSVVSFLRERKMKILAFANFACAGHITGTVHAVYEKIVFSSVCHVLAFFFAPVAIKPHRFIDLDEGHSWRPGHSRFFRNHL